MPPSDDTKDIYNICNSVDQDMSLRAWLLRWALFDVHGAVMRNNDIRYFDMPFLCCEEEYGYALRLTAFIGQCYSLSMEDLRLLVFIIFLGLTV